MFTRIQLAGLLAGFMLPISLVMAASPTTPLASSPPKTPDQKFVVTAAKSGLAEAAMGRLAGRQADNASVTQFAQQMVADHTKTNDELLTLAMQKGIKPPQAMSDDSQLEYDKLVPLKGSDFDTEYMRAMVADHQAAVALFQQEIKTGSDQVIQAWARKTLPMLRHHLQMAEQTQKDLEGRK